jgi:hypothetical protein
MSLAETVLVVVLVAVHIFPVWRIARRMGFPGPLGIVALLPGINVLFAWYLALRGWPSERPRA